MAVLLKVMPEVVFEFRFRLQPSKVWEGVDAVKKQDLFQRVEDEMEDMMEEMKGKIRSRKKSKEI